MPTLGRLVILVKSYEEAMSFYVDKLGMEVSTDVEEGERRFVHLRFPFQKGMGIWLLKAETEKDKESIGRQTGDQPCSVIYTDEFYPEYERFMKAGVQFLEKPVEGTGAISAHFADLYGNKFVLVEIF